MVVAESIPLELRQMVQWVVWSFEVRDGKKTKVPYSPMTGRRAAVNDPDCWVSFEDAIKFLGIAKGVDGIGFVFSEADDYCGVDIDGCIVAGEIKPNAMKIIEQLGGYTEISPSGKGIKIIVRAKLGEGRRGKGIEIYDRGRFFTVTGQKIHDMAGEVIPERQEVIDSLANEVSPKAKPTNGSPTRNGVKAFRDHEVIDRIKESKQGSKFEALWAGDIGTYDSASEADLALCNMLAFWSGGDEAQVDRLYRASGLMREKWNGTRGNSTYGKITIDAAFAGRSDFYHPYSEVLPEHSNVRDGPQDGKGFEWLSDLKRLDASDKWLWEGYINRGGITLLSALWKAGKTTLISHLLRAFRGGAEMFCGKPIAKAKILVVTEEDEATWCERQEMLIIEESTHHVGMICRPFIGRSNNKSWVEFIEKAAAIVDANDFDLVIIDTLAKLWPVKDENSASMVDEALMPLWAIVKNGRTALLLVHHLRKGDGMEATGSRGSGALTAFVETIVEFRRFDQQSRSCTKRVLDGFGRYKETDGELVLDLTPAGYVACGDRDEANALNLVEKIADILPKTAPGVSYGDLVESWPDETVPRKKVMLATLRQGTECGAFERTGSGMKGNPYTYWMPEK